LGQAIILLQSYYFLSRKISLDSPHRYLGFVDRPRDSPQAKMALFLYQLGYNLRYRCFLTWLGICN